MSISDKNLYYFINSRLDEYKKNTDIRRIIIDYISGQTDKYFIKECKTNIKDFEIQKSCKKKSNMLKYKCKRGEKKWEYQ